MATIGGFAREYDQARPMVDARETTAQPTVLGKVGAELTNAVAAVQLLRKEVQTFADSVLGPQPSETAKSANGHIQTQISSRGAELESSCAELQAAINGLRYEVERLNRI